MVEIDLERPFKVIGELLRVARQCYRVINGRVFGSGRPKRDDVQSGEQLKTGNLPGATAGAWSSVTEETIDRVAELRRWVSPGGGE